MLIGWSTTHRAHTGPLQYRLTYSCALCGVQSAAEVTCEASGSSSAAYGIGASAGAARGRAMDAANIYAHAALRCAACPQCGALQPDVVAELEASAGAAEKRRVLRLPIATGAAIVVTALLAVPAIRDWKHSLSLSAMTIGFAIFVAAATMTFFVWPRRMPAFPQGAVSFWRPAPNGMLGWVLAARPAVMPRLAAAPRDGHKYGLAVTFTSGLLAFTAMAVWADTYKSVYVLDDAALSIRVDGEAVASKEAASEFSDATVRKITVRKGEAHRVEATDAFGKTYVLLLGASDTHGGVIAPGGYKQGMCVLEDKALYGTSTEDRAVAVLNKKADGFALPRSYDDVFAAPPSSAQPASGAKGTSRWTLRAVSCNELAKQRLTPFRRASATFPGMALL